MAKRKGISISLAAKCQLLFGLAVIVIIAGALAVPWQRMEQLAKQPNVKAARFAADLVFRQAHDGVTGPATRSTTLPVEATGSAPATGSGGIGGAAANWDRATLVEGSYSKPRILVATAPNGALTGPGAVGDKVAVDAMKAFRQRAQETEYGRRDTVKLGDGTMALIYRYAAAIRLDPSCVGCHPEYEPWMKAAGGGGGSVAATRAEAPATTATAPQSLPAQSMVASAQTGLIAGAGAPVVGLVRIDVPYQTDESQLLLNRIVIVVAGILGGALAIVVFYLITSRLILQPVRVLKNTAEKVSGGDLNIRSAISTGDEFQHLSETFNTMLANLKVSRDQLEATNRSLDTRVGELAQSNVDLFEANRLKSEFLTNVTHELRTPLNAIIGFADLMAETAAKGGDPKLQRYSENIRGSARQLLDLINDLLDLAKIEAGKLVIREEKVNVADMCEALANFMRPLAQKKAIELELTLDPEMPVITTDPGRFQQILYNFLSNAIKFTPNDGHVTITARSERETAGAGEMIGGAAVAGPLEAAVSAAGAEGAAAGTAPEKTDVVTAVRIAISDTGPGISLEDQKVIFDKFRQLDGSVTRHHAGSGLGLAISRELASMLGGRIELVSTPGKGATFSLIVPVVLRRGPVDVSPMLENT
jgi:two-component system, NarL family, sensor histidine kinase BarA